MCLAITGYNIMIKAFSFPREQPYRTKKVHDRKKIPKMIEPIPHIVHLEKYKGTHFTKSP